MKAQSRFNHRGRFETCLSSIYWIPARASFSVRDPSLGEIANLAAMTSRIGKEICETPTIAVAVAFNRRLAVDGKFFCVLIAKTKGAIMK
jgi:hypothetical protein